jgi:hypothetical protein
MLRQAPENLPLAAGLSVAAEEKMSSYGSHICDLTGQLM